MKLTEGMLIYGTKKYQILSYFVVPITSMKNAEREITQELGNKADVKLTSLIGEDWPHGILLVEQTTEFPDQIVRIIMDTISAGLCIKGLIALCCMLDGVFGGYDELLVDDFSNQIYCVYTKGQGIDLLLDDDARESKAWHAVIGKHRKSLFNVT